MRRADEIRRATNMLVSRLVHEMRVELRAAATRLSSEIGRPVKDVAAMVAEEQSRFMSKGLGATAALEKAVCTVRADVLLGKR